jgi:hypothetical protein
MLSRQAGVAQLAERQPSKLNVAGSIPVSRSTACATPNQAMSRYAFGFGFFFLGGRLGVLSAIWHLLSVTRE